MRVPVHGDVAGATVRRIRQYRGPRLRLPPLSLRRSGVSRVPRAQTCRQSRCTAAGALSDRSPTMPGAAGTRRSPFGVADLTDQDGRTQCACLPPTAPGWRMRAGAFQRVQLACQGSRLPRPEHLWHRYRDLLVPALHPIPGWPGPLRLRRRRAAAGSVVSDSGEDRGSPWDTGDPHTRPGPG